MSDLLLTEAERLRFAAWLEREGESGNAMAEQMAKIAVPEAVIKHYKAEAAAALIIARKLRSIESETISALEVT